MDDARELILQDVRCFQDEQRGRLRPITLLVGENSTGKTTFLGCYRVLHRMLSKRGIGESLDFNEEPFAMGSFRDVVRSRRGRSGRIEEFKIGFLMDKGSDDPISPYEMSFTFRERGSEPVVSSLRFQFDPDAFLELRSRDDAVTVRIPDHIEEVKGNGLWFASPASLRRASSNRIFRTSCSRSVRLMGHLLIGGPHETGQLTCYYTGQTTCS